MRARASLIAALIAALLTLTACTGLGPGSAAPHRDTPDPGGDRGGGDRGGGMM